MITGNKEFCDCSSECIKNHNIKKGFSFFGRVVYYNSGFKFKYMPFIVKLGDFE